MRQSSRLICLPSVLAGGQVYGRASTDVFQKKLGPTETFSLPGTAGVPPSPSGPSPALPALQVGQVTPFCH